MIGEIEEQLYSVGQLAEMIGCSVRSIYRWEEAGAIPKPDRIERGEVSARVYTQSQVEEIRKKVRGRLTYAAIIREPRRESLEPQGNRPRSKLGKKKARKRGPDEPEVLARGEDWAPLFASAARTSQKEGCVAVTV